MSKATYFLVDKDFSSYSQSLDLTIPIVLFKDINNLGPSLPSPALETITQQQREKEMDLPAFYLHTSGSTGHPKIVGEVRGPRLLVSL